MEKGARTVGLCQEINRFCQIKTLKIWNEKINVDAQWDGQECVYKHTIVKIHANVTIVWRKQEK